MTIQLSPTTFRYLNEQVAKGRYSNLEDALDVAVSMLRLRDEVTTEVEVGLRDLDEGRFTTYSTSDRDRFRRDVQPGSGC